MGWVIGGVGVLAIVAVGIVVWHVRTNTLDYF